MVVISMAFVPDKFDDRINNKKHAVVSVPGGPLSLIYGTPSAHHSRVAEEIKNFYDDIRGSASLEIICVDPNTKAPWTQDLDPQEAGFKKPDYEGSGWNAKIYSDVSKFTGKVIAGMHRYCGSASTNLNGGNWLEHVPSHYIHSAIKKIHDIFPGHEVETVIYHKDEKTGTVPERLQKLTKTPYASML